MMFTSLSNFASIDFLSVSPKLMYAERKDTKYIFHYHDLDSIVGSLSTEYNLVLHYGKISQLYSTIYYDSPDLKFYLAHHNGHGNRLKMRTRTYEDGSSFFEVKQKTNKGITRKERYTDADKMASGLIPQIEVVYERITLYDKSFQEKITIDFNLQFIAGKNRVQYPEIVIAETKKIKNIQSSFMEEMKKRKITSYAISKYCLGMISLFDGIKKNNFKKIVHKIQKLKNTHELSAAYQ